MLEQMKQVAADTDEFKNFVTPEIFAVARFKPSDLNLLEEPIEFSANDPAVTSDYYNLKNKKLDPNINLATGFVFKPGHNAGKSNTKRSYSDHKGGVSLFHNQLQTELYKQLAKAYGAENVGTEIQCGSSNRIDIVIQNKRKYTFYEIKVLKSAKICIREAVGQLLEYAYYSNKLDIDKLVVVSHHPLGNEDQEYIERLNQRFNLNLDYLQVTLDTGT